MRAADREQLVTRVLLGGWLEALSTVPRTFVLATVAVPVVIYGVLPHLHRVRARVVDRS